MCVLTRRLTYDLNWFTMHVSDPDPEPNANERGLFRTAALSAMIDFKPKLSVDYICI